MWGITNDISIVQAVEPSFFNSEYSIQLPISRRNVVHPSFQSTLP
jgi:hypothetical protein